MSASQRETTTVRIADLCRHFQVRTKVSEKTVTRYAEAMQRGEIFPPIEVARIVAGSKVKRNGRTVEPWRGLQGVPIGVLEITDGFQRCEANEGNGTEEIEAYVTDCTREEALLRAYPANFTHGEPLKRSDYRNAYRMYVHGRGYLRPDSTIKQYREMVVDFRGAVSHMTLWRWTKRDFPWLARQIARPEERGLRRPELLYDIPAETLHDAKLLRDLDQIKAGAPLYSPYQTQALILKLEEVAAALREGSHPEPLDF
jgi:hypothetical protein